jgi:hypothetical protein
MYQPVECDADPVPFPDRLLQRVERQIVLNDLEARHPTMRRLNMSVTNDT